MAGKLDSSGTTEYFPTLKKKKKKVRNLFQKKEKISAMMLYSLLLQGHSVISLCGCGCEAGLRVEKEVVQKFES